MIWLILPILGLIFTFLTWHLAPVIILIVVDMIVAVIVFFNTLASCARMHSLYYHNYYQDTKQEAFYVLLKEKEWLFKPFVNFPRAKE